MKARGDALRARRGRAMAVAAALGVLLPSLRNAQGAPSVVDRTVARFFSPETGGAEYPRFVFERTLAFQARLAAMATTPDGIGESYGERDVREALELNIAQEILSSLADKVIADSPPTKRPSADELATIARDLGGALAERLGGRQRIDAAARAERVEPSEVEAMVHREAMAAWYIDRTVSPLLHISEEQLRVVFRSAAHPYRGQPFEQVRGPLEHWFVAERLRATESAFLQAARSRVRIILTS
jgi:hypothetical protein